MSFKDNFSKQAIKYAKYRPHYPAALFEYLASIVLERKKAWDCGTGNGQAALGLTFHFDQIIATDLSEKQIANAIIHEKITYCVTAAEQTQIEPHSIDLITVAQAIHWFDFDKFYREVKRVLKSGGILAVWCYSLLQIVPRIDSVIKEYYTNILGQYWPRERQLVDDKYGSIPFPFEEVNTPHFNMEAVWDLKDLLNYLDTWSATQRFIKQHGFNPGERIIENLARAWGSRESKKIIKWPIHLRVGKLPSYE